MKLLASIVLALLFLAISLGIDYAQEVDAEADDQHESCGYWASIGECQKNPGYMLVSCQKSCAAAGHAIPVAENLPASFYDIIEKDLQGNDVHFSQFRGKVVYLINVASYCGFTEENYAMFRELEKYENEGLVIVLAPCNSFGAQEPGDGFSISSFAQKQGYTGLILSKDDVNGDYTRPSFKYLKHVAQKPYISWNFDGKFLVGRTGQAYVTNNDVLIQNVEYLLTQPLDATDNSMEL